MSRICTLLGALVLNIAFACAVSDFAAAGTPRQSPPLPTGVANIARAHTAGLRSKRAHTACKVAPNRHRKHTRRCVKPHSTHTRARTHIASRSGKRASLAKARTHTKRSGKQSTAVTVSVPNTAATIASVLAAPCEGAELTPDPANLAQVEAATLCLVNQERARNGELPLLANAQLAQSSQLHSDDMVSEDYFAHIAPNGETPLERIQATGYIPNTEVGYSVGENIAWGTLNLSTPSAIVTAWIASPEHLANILNHAYRDTAVGVDPAAPPSLAESQPGAVYTQEFGVITR